MKQVLFNFSIYKKIINLDKNLILFDSDLDQMLRRKLIYS